MALVKAGPPRLDSDRDRRSSRRYWVWPSWPTYTGLTYRSSYTIAGSSGPMDERQSSQVASHTPHATTATRISMRCRANDPSQQQDGRLCYRILSLLKDVGLLGYPKRQRNRPMASNGMRGEGGIRIIGPTSTNETR